MHILMALALAVLGPGDVPASGIYAWRQADAAAFAQEKARLDALREDKALTRAEADRLADMIAAEASTDAADYAARRARIEAALASARADFAVMRAGGPYPDDWQGSRWLKARAATDDADARALFEHVFLDQSALSLASGLEGADDAAFRAALAPEIAEILAGNAAWLKETLAHIGWFDISRYGAEASQAAWLIVQHADDDPEWQKRVLTILAPKVETGDMQGRYFAYLMDRIAVNAGRPQTYGTQGGCVDGVWQPREVVDPVRLDIYRAEAGLEPMDDYRKRFAGACR